MKAEYNKFTARYATRIAELILRNWKFDDELIDVVKSRVNWGLSSSADIGNIVIDKDHGPLILELNARPGLAIQRPMAPV